MKWIFVNCVYALILCQVLAVPSGRFSKEEGDSVEQELIRNHHSAAWKRLKSKVNQASSDVDESSPIESIEEVRESDDDDDRSIDEDDLYDITVGDVIRDVLLTLRDNPRLVKELIASEKAKLAEQIDAFNNLVDADSAGDSLAGFMKPAEQLNSVPKSVEKKAGRSGMAVIPGQVMENKRTDEVMNDEYTRDSDTTESQQYNDFLEQPHEGGQYDLMSDNDDSESILTDATTNSEDTSESESDSNEINDDQISDSASENAQKTENSSDNVSITSGTSDKQADKTKSNENDDRADLNSEAELAWLLHKGRIRNSDKRVGNDDSGTNKHYVKM